MGKTVHISTPWEKRINDSVDSDNFLFSENDSALQKSKKKLRSLMSKPDAKVAIKSHWDQMKRRESDTKGKQSSDDTR